MLLVQEQEKILYYAMGIRKKINKDIELFHNNYTSIPIDKNNICINYGAIRYRYVTSNSLCG